MVLAAGSGSRMKLNQNKVYLSLGGGSLPVLHYPLAAFDRHPYVDEIVLVIRREDRELVEEMRAHACFPRKPVRVVEGGERRSDSVCNALAAAGGDIVIIHDGARPLLKQRYISDCIEAMATVDGATVAIPCTDTLWAVDSAGQFVEKRDNQGLYRIQTPQCFAAAVLRECHEATPDKSSITDDSTVLAARGHRVKLLPGSQTNIKLTYQDDLALAEQYIRMDEEIRGLIHD